MMKTFTKKVRLILALLFVSVMTFNHAFSQGLPPETEILGFTVYHTEADETIFPAPIGFNFDFYGNTYSQVYITTNGLVMFNHDSLTWRNVTIPTPDNLVDDTVNNFIAPFWDDLKISKNGEVIYHTYGTAPNRKFIVQFVNMYFNFRPFHVGTFQVILYEGSNNIQIQYRSIVNLLSDPASGNSATIGLENIDGSDGVECSYNTAGYVESGKAILFTPGAGTYTFDDNALYDGVFLTDTVPRATSAPLLSPAYNSTVGETVNFQWEAASHASCYNLVICSDYEMRDTLHASDDLYDLSYEYTLAPGQTYFWTVYPRNSEDIISWSEFWRFHTSTTPPLTPVSQSIYIEHGDIQMLELMYTGGDEEGKTATLTALPDEGTLYQNNEGVPGAEITEVPTVLTDPSHRVFYSANEGTGMDVGSFDFNFSDGTGTSSSETYTVNVSPVGVPHFLEAAKATYGVEITFDREMADPTGKHGEFSIREDGIGVTSTSCSLKDGDPQTIVVYTSPALDITNTITVAYTQGTVESESGGLLESFAYRGAIRRAQTISFSALDDKVYGDADFALSASSTSGLDLTFISSNTEIVSVDGTTASIHNAGEAKITASHVGTITYAPATYSRFQLVNKATATVSLSDLTQEYTGSGIAATVTTVPDGLDVLVTYDGSVTLPVEYGEYDVLAEVVDPSYSGSATGTLNITDVTAPVPDVANLPDLSDQCSVSPTIPTATDNASGTVVGVSDTPLPVITQGITVITWTYDDGHGNIETQEQTVTIADVTDPVPPVMEEVNGECSATVAAPNATDNCAGSVVGTTSDPTTYSTEGTYVITWTFDDGNGNIVYADQNVIVDDVTDPVTPSLPDLEGECTVTAVPPTTTDNCAGSVVATTEDLLTYTTEGTHVITWTFDDGNGNSTVATQNVILDDVTAPANPTLPDLIGDCSVTAVAPTTTDDCIGTVTGITTDELTYSVQGSYVITWTFDDGNGNSTVATQNVIVDDQTDPVTPVLDDLTGECSVTAVAPTTTDACAGTLTGTTSDPLTYSTQGSYVITWTFDDGNGNSTVATQNVIVDDQTNPVTPVLDDLTGECSVTAVAPTTTDACTGTVTGTTSDPLSYSTQGSYVITWTFDDGNGNTIDVDQNVIVSDVSDPEIPTLPDVTGECTATATIPTTTDACEGTISGSTTDELSYATQGTHVITWTFDDGNGNTIYVDQNVIVDDVTPPTATAPSDVVTCDGTVISIGLTAITDNCTTPVVTYELTGATTGSGSGSDASAVVFDPGVTTVTYTLDDGNGNTNQYSCTVSYEEVEDIVVTVDAGTLSCDNTGSYQWINCADNSIIDGETSSSYRPGVNGDYAVILTQGSCSDTSECFTLDYTGIGTDSYQDYKVYPNPARDYVSIDMVNEQTNASIRVFDMTGQLIHEEELNRFTQTRLDVSRFKAGVYMIQIQSDQVNSVTRIMKE